MHGSAHSSVLSATMYPTMGGCDQSLETLDPDDIAGIEALYPPITKTGSIPSAPAGLAAAPDGSNPSSSVALSWTDTATNANGYLVGRSSDGVTFTQVAQLGSSAASCPDSGLAARTAQATAQVVLQAPAAPSRPSPTNGATANGSVTLSWGATAGAQGYDVYFGTSSAPGLRASNVTSTSQSAGSLNAGTTYYWMVVAKNSVGSTASPLWSFTTKSTGKPKR